MSVLCDSEIKEYAEKGMITPFFDKQVREVAGRKIISHGLSSYGYDIAVGNHFKIFTNAYSAVVDPLDFSEECFVEREVQLGESIWIPPNSYALAASLERIKMPRDLLAICLGKSTYARSGIIVNVTPLEPEWEGDITIEISNATPNAVKVYAGMGICQLIFLRASKVCKVSYKDKDGKYQGQSGVTLPKV